MEDSYIRFESTLQQPMGDSSTIEYKFSLDKVFCPEELVLFIQEFLNGTFEDEFIEKIMNNFGKSADDLIEGVESFYAELEEDVYTNPEKYGITEDDLEAVKEATGGPSDEVEAVTDISNVQEFKKQIDNNPQFLKKVFKGYMEDILRD